MCLVWILVFLTLSFVVPFLIWGSVFEDAFPRDGEWLKEWGRWAWLIAIILLIFDLLLPIPGTAVMVTLGLVYGPILGGIIGSLGSVISGYLAYVLCKIWEKCCSQNCRPKALEQREMIFEKQAGLLFYLWLPVMPEVVACMAGLSRMPSRLFLASLATGSVPLAFVFSFIGATSQKTPS